MFTVVFLLATMLIANGTVMIFAPESWYTLVPGATDTGPLNVHFVRDIGVVYAIAGAGLLWRLIDPWRGWPVVLASGLFLLAHACLHFVELLSTAHHNVYYPSDIVTIYLPAVLVIYFARPRPYPLPRVVRRLISRLAHRQIAQFERRFGYDGEYLHDMADTSLDAIARFSMLDVIGTYREDLPLDAWYAAKLIGTISEDCGPCTQLLIRMAERDGVGSATLRAIVTNKVTALDPGTALIVRSARATLAREDKAREYQEEIAQRWGRRGLLSFALALSSSRLFPQLKYALGHGQACTKIQLSDREMVVYPAHRTAKDFG